MCQNGDGVDSESVISRLICPLQENSTQEKFLFSLWKHMKSKYILVNVTNKYLMYFNLVDIWVRVSSIVGLSLNCTVAYYYYFWVGRNKDEQWNNIMDTSNSPFTRNGFRNSWVTPIQSNDEGWSCLSRTKSLCSVPWRIILMDSKAGRVIFVEWRTKKKWLINSHCNAGKS